MPHRTCDARANPAAFTTRAGGTDAEREARALSRPDLGANPAAKTTET